MRLILQCKTNVETFYIRQSNDGRFHPAFNNEGLGSYDNILQTTELLDISKIVIPEEPSEREKLI